MSDTSIRPTAPKGHLKLKPPFRLNAADVAWALPANKTKDVGRIFESDVIRVFVGYEYPNTAPKGRLKLKPPFRLNASDVAWALPTNKTKDVGRILESDIIRTFIGYKYPNTAPKDRLKLKPPSRLNASDVACFARENQRRRSDSRIRRYQGICRIRVSEYSL